MVAAFDVENVNSNPARFDQKKADAINAEQHPAARRRRLDRPAARRTSWRTATTPGSTTPRFAEAAKLVQTRIAVLGDAWDLLKFLDHTAFTLDEKSAANELRADAVPVLDAALTASTGVGGVVDGRDRGRAEGVRCWTRSSSSSRKAFAIRSGWRPLDSSVSPPLFESLELLGRDRSHVAAARRTRITPLRRRGGVKNGAEIFDSLLVGP